MKQQKLKLKDYIKIIKISWRIYISMSKEELTEFKKMRDSDDDLGIELFIIRRWKEIKDQ